MKSLLIVFIIFVFTISHVNTQDVRPNAFKVFSNTTIVPCSDLYKLDELLNTVYNNAFQWITESGATVLSIMPTTTTSQYDDSGECKMRLFASVTVVYGSVPFNWGWIWYILSLLLPLALFILICAGGYMWYRRRMRQQNIGEPDEQREAFVGRGRRLGA